MDEVLLLGDIWEYGMNSSVIAWEDRYWQGNSYSKNCVVPPSLHGVSMAKCSRRCEPGGAETWV